MNKMYKYLLLPQEINEIVNQLNNEYYHISKLIYSANFHKAKLDFLKTEQVLSRLIANVLNAGEDADNRLIQNIMRISQYLEQIIISFEQQDYQYVVDTLIYQLGDALNEHKEIYQNIREVE